MLIHKAPLFIDKAKNNMRNFTITTGGRQLAIEQKDEQNFIVNNSGRTSHLYLQQDNEGANHWFEDGDKETPQSIETGKAIEAYLANK